MPCLFTLCKLPPAFNTIWGHVPVVRAVMFVPYYLLGYMYFASVDFSCRWSVAVLIGMLAVCVCWPFDIYDIDCISAVNVGWSFLECAIVLCIVVRLRYIKWGLSILGRISAFWWLLHMPVLSVFHKLPAFGHANKVMSLFGSLALAIAVNYMYLQAKRLAGRIWSRA